MTETRTYQDPGNTTRNQLHALAQVQLGHGSGPPILVLTAPPGVLQELERQHNLKPV